MSVTKCYEDHTLNFKSEHARNEWLLINKESIIKAKTSTEYRSAFKGLVNIPYQARSESASKALFDMRQNHAYPVINTSNWLDFHGDAHIGNVWTNDWEQSVKSIGYVMDHSTAIKDVIVMPNELAGIFVQKMPWSSLGQSGGGSTFALIYDIDKASIIDDKARSIIDKGYAIQNSVRMIYQDMVLCINDERPEYRENKENFDKYISSILNKYRALENGYFWAVLKAENVREGSMLLEGSNEITPLLLPGFAMTEKSMLASNETTIVEPVTDDTEVTKGIFSFLHK